MNDNIAAISTANGPAGVAVIRISGINPLSVAEKMFTPSGKVKVSDFEPNKMYAGEIHATSFTDYGMCVFFKSPKSFTGEDTVEFHSHGGIAITRGILQKILSLGVRLAERGEFTKRAFMNGKLSLSSCEGLIDMINSEWESGVKAGYSLYREKLSNEVSSLQNTLLDALSHIEVDIDFPEENLEKTSLTAVKKDLLSVNERINYLLSTFSTGSRIKNGVKVAICGKPNTGKSSILNALLSFDKAIVSDIAGTTRDVVEGYYDYNGVRFNLFDTAGIRDSSDKIESIGVALSKKVLLSCDIVLFILDGGDISELDEEIYSLVKDKNLITVINKTDLTYKKDKRANIYVSAKTGDNIEALKDAIYNATIGNVDVSSDFICEERHYNALLKAKDSITSAINNVDNVSLDILSIDVKNGWDALGEITGKTATEEIIDNIFSKFCVGK